MYETNFIRRTCLVLGKLRRELHQFLFRKRISFWCYYHVWCWWRYETCKGSIGAGVTCQVLSDDMSSITPFYLPNHNGKPQCEHLRNAATSSCEKVYTGSLNLQRFCFCKWKIYHIWKRNCSFYVEKKIVWVFEYIFNYNLYLQNVLYYELIIYIIHCRNKTEWRAFHLFQLTFLKWMNIVLTF